MSDLTFARLHEHLEQSVPELGPAIALLCEDDVFSEDGVPGQYMGTSVVLETYIAVLLARPASPLRDAALVRVFAFVEAMFAARDDELVTLAQIQLVEGQPAWWFQRAMSFMGPLYRQAAGEGHWRKEPGWVEGTAPGASPLLPSLYFHDLYDVRQAVATLLAPEGITLSELLDKTHPL